MHQLLARLRAEVGAQRMIVVFMDNATIHRTLLVKKVLRLHNVHCLFNCPYSPQLNPIEAFYSLIKRRVRDYELKSKAHMVAVLLGVLNKIKTGDIRAVWWEMIREWKR